MDIYSVVLFVHLLALLLAAGTATLAFYAALQLRDASSPGEIARWGRFVASVVPCFPIATLLLAGSGAYLTQTQWHWTTSWIDAGIVGLALIVACGSGIEARRGQALEHEVRASGLSARARALQRDPLAWTAKVTTLTLMLAVVFLMTTKPAALGSALALVVALLVGALGAVPFWRSAPRGDRPAPAGGQPVPDAVPRSRVNGEAVAAATTPLPRTER